MMYEEEVIVSTLEGCKKIVPILPDINTEVGEEGGTLLEIVCAFTNDVEVVKYLLEQGANVHHTDKYGRNAFAYSWFNRNPYMDVFINEELKKYW